jgi:hypothetical protein
MKRVSRIVGSQRNFGQKIPQVSVTESRAMTDLSVTLKYNPHHRTNIGPKETPAVRVYRSDPEGVTLQIRREREYMSAWLSFADALAVADAICEAAQKSGA